MVAQKISEIAQDLGSRTQNAEFTIVLLFLKHFSKYFVVFWPNLFAQNFQTEILVTQKKLRLEILHTATFTQRREWQNK